MYQAKVLADSINPCGNRLTTFELTYPRFVHSELLTHRMLSRNSASSRAIPIAKMLERVKTDPVLPVWWGKNQSGMQAREELEPSARRLAKQLWLEARDKAVESAELLSMQTGVHKQIVNRLLEPWMWITVIASATDWWHFFNLRAHSDAQPEIAHIAYMALELYDASKPKEVSKGSWHLPLVFDEDYAHAGISLAALSAGRCARVSYLTHDGKRDIQADLDLCQRLITSKPMHASPLEHPAYALDVPDMHGNFRGWIQYRKLLQDEYTTRDIRERV